MGISVKVNGTFNLTAASIDSGGLNVGNDLYYFSSSSTTYVTVAPVGDSGMINPADGNNYSKKWVITGVAVGTANITAKSMLSGVLSSAIPVTVTSGSPATVTIVPG